jgi:hypothetical protein
VANQEENLETKPVSFEEFSVDCQQGGATTDGVVFSMKGNIS